MLLQFDMNRFGRNVNFDEVMSLEERKRDELLREVAGLCIDGISEEEKNEKIYRLIRRFPTCFAEEDLIVPIDLVRKAVERMITLDIPEKAQRNLGPGKLWYPLAMAGAKMVNWCGDEGKVVPDELKTQLVGKILEPGRWLVADGMRHQLTWIEAKKDEVELIISPGEMVPADSSIFCLGLVNGNQIKF